jgi:hypothetical protein
MKSPEEASEPSGPSLPGLSDEFWSAISPRRRAILFLRMGWAPLSDAEMATVPGDQRSHVLEVKPRSLRTVGRIFGISKERVRQIQNAVLAKVRQTFSADEFAGAFSLGEEHMLPE